MMIDTLQVTRGFIKFYYTIKFLFRNIKYFKNMFYYNIYMRTFVIKQLCTFKGFAAQEDFGYNRIRTVKPSRQLTPI